MAIATTSGQTAGHPLWHLLIVAGGAIAVYFAIRTKEYRDRRVCARHAPRPNRADEPSWQRSDGRRSPNTAMLALAALSLGSGAIHASVTSEHFHEAFIFGTFFLFASTAQAAWAIAILHRPTTTLLVVGAVGNAITIILWTLTRTIGLPAGPEPWHPEAIGPQDAISTILELVLVLSAVQILRRTATHHRGSPDRASRILR